MGDKSNKNQRIEHLFKPLLIALHEIQEHDFYGPHAYYLNSIIDGIEFEIYDFIPAQKDYVERLLHIVITRIKELIKENERIAPWDVDYSNFIELEKASVQLNTGLQKLIYNLDKISHLDAEFTAHLNKKSRPDFDAGQFEKPSEKLSFGFNGQVEQLRGICIKLNNKLGMLKEEKTSIDDLVKVLSSNDIESEKKEIYLGIYNNQFRYILDKFKGTFFTRLSLEAIEKSELFYSKNGNKLKANTLSSNKSDYPEHKGKIDEIFMNTR